MRACCAGRLKIVASDATQPRPSQTFQTRNDFIPNPGPNEPPIATQANTDALPAQLRTATHPGASFNSGASSTGATGNVLLVCCCVKQFMNRPNMIGKASSHCWRLRDGAVNAACLNGYDRNEI